MKNVPHYKASDIRPKTQSVISSNGDIFDFIAAIYEAFGDITRLKILYIIEREKTVNLNEMCRILETEAIVIHKDLKLLEDLKVITCVKYKQQFIYALNSERKDFVIPLLDKVKAHISMKKLFQMEEFAMFIRKVN